MMEIDQQKFLSLVMEKTTQKVNALQSQVIILESQLAIAIEECDSLKKELEAKASGKSKQQTGTY